MQLISGLCCQECTAPHANLNLQTVDKEGASITAPIYEPIFRSLAKSRSSISPLVVAPMLHQGDGDAGVLQEYVQICKTYNSLPNTGVLVTLKFCLPSLRVSDAFTDIDMFCLCEILLKYSNTDLSFIRRLDFSKASRPTGNTRTSGFTSHGAFCLAKVLLRSTTIQQVWMQRNRIGPYGASAIFIAASTNATLTNINMRRCWIGERGGLALAEVCLGSLACGLREVDVSANHIGFRGSLMIEQALQERGPNFPTLDVDLEGNLVLQEVMAGVTHGLGILFGIVAGMLLSSKVKNKSQAHAFSCMVYSTSLIVLYTASTLYHSFFTMKHTKYIFGVIDKCAIYILIAGSYTPFLHIVLQDYPKWSVGLLIFIWTACFFGVVVEAMCPTWKYKGRFSLTMYLCMGWCCMICMPDLLRILPRGAVNLVVLGGVGYTSGVPFFVRDNNLDHSIWHLFVLAGSIIHWIGIYIYVADM